MGGRSTPISHDISFYSENIGMNTARSRNSGFFDMLMTAISLICFGLAGLVFGFSPDGWLGLAATAVPDAAPLALHIPPQAVMAVAGAIYLSGIILLAGALLTKTAVAHLQTLSRQRADLESLQS